MSARAMHWAMAIIQAGQLENTISPKLVLLKLADRADDSGKCWPSHSRTSKDLQISEGTVRSSIKYLRDRGVIKVIPRKSDDGDVNLANLYFLQISDSFGTVNGSQGRPGGVGQISTHPVGQIPTRGGSNLDPESSIEAKSKSSSTRASARAPAGAGAAAKADKVNQNKALRIVHGIHCWTQDDVQTAEALLARYGPEAVAHAVAALVAHGHTRIALYEPSPMQRKADKQ